MIYKIISIRQRKIIINMQEKMNIQSGLIKCLFSKHDDTNVTLTSTVFLFKIKNNKTDRYLKLESYDS